MHVVWFARRMVTRSTTRSRLPFRISAQNQRPDQPPPRSPFLNRPPLRLLPNLHSRSTHRRKRTSAPASTNHGFPARRQERIHAAERTGMSQEEIGKYRTTAQQNFVDAMRAAEERYEKAKQAGASGASALHDTKETGTHGLAATTAYLAAKGTEAKDTAVHGPESLSRRELQPRIMLQRRPSRNTMLSFRVPAPLPMSLQRRLLLQRILQWRRAGTGMMQRRILQSRLQ